MKALLSIGLWIVSIACFGYAIYRWAWVAKSTAGGPQTSDMAVVMALILVGVASIVAWFLMRRKETDEEISITR